MRHTNPFAHRRALVLSLLGTPSMLIMLCLAGGHDAVSATGVVTGQVGRVMTSTFKGRVRAGESLSRSFGDGFTFRLEPEQHASGDWRGWRVVVNRRGATTNLAEMTPPWRGPGPLGIYGGDFLPDSGGPTSPREFIFSPEVGREISWNDVGQGQAAPPSFGVDDLLARIAAFGRGRLSIDAYELAVGPDASRTGFHWMRFEVDLTWRPSVLLPPYASEEVLAAPRPFAPGLVSTTNGIAFSPNGLTVYVSRFVDERDERGRPRSRLFQHRWLGGEWSPPEAVPFSNAFTDYQPVLSPDGQRLFFTSTRPQPDTVRELRQNIWVSHRDANGWAAPEIVAELATPGWDGYAVPTRSGRLYFVSDRQGGLGGVDIWTARPQLDGRYGPAVNVAAVNSAASDSDIWVDPDERFMVFTRSVEPAANAGPGVRAEIDLWVALRSNGVWHRPRRLDRVNSPEWELSPTVTPDGRYLFFARRGAIFRIELSAVLTAAERRQLAASGR